MLISVDAMVMRLEILETKATAVKNKQVLLLRTHKQKNEFLKSFCVKTARN